MTEASKTARVMVLRPDGFSDKIEGAIEWEIRDESGALVVRAASGWTVYPGGSWQRMKFVMDEESQ